MVITQEEFDIFKKIYIAGVKELESEVNRRVQRDYQAKRQELKSIALVSQAIYAKVEKMKE